MQVKGDKNEINQVQPKIRIQNAWRVQILGQVQV